MTEHVGDDEEQQIKFHWPEQISLHGGFLQRQSHIPSMYGYTIIKNREY